MGGSVIWLINLFVNMKKFLYWAPRILGIIMAGFITMFAFDVFEEGKTAGEIALALLMHLLPTILLVISLVVAWKMEKIGGWLFIALAAASLFLNGFDPTPNLILTLPLLLIGAMFLWHYNKFVKGAADSPSNPVG